MDDWTGRRRRRIRDDVGRALDDPDWFGDRGAAYESVEDNEDVMARAPRGRPRSTVVVALPSANVAVTL